MESAAEKRFANESTQKKRETAIEKWMKKTVFALNELQGLEQITENGDVQKIEISQFWQGEKAAECFDMVRKSIGTLNLALRDLGTDARPLREDKELVAKIKAVLDAIIELLHFVKPLHAGEGLDRDEVFYSFFNEL